MRKRILIVDDEQAMLNSMQRDLRTLRNEFQVFTTTNGQEVSKLTEEWGVDLIITDVLMPGKEGIEIIREIRQKHPTVKIIAMSGAISLGRADYLKIAETAGSAFSLHKPFSRAQLISAIRQVLNQNT